MVSSASISAAPRTSGATDVSLAPVLGFDVPIVITTMPCDARNGPQLAIDDSGETKPGTMETAANGGVASVG